MNISKFCIVLDVSQVDPIFIQPYHIGPLAK
jgi:hypothetical protein